MTGKRRLAALLPAVTLALALSGCAGIAQLELPPLPEFRAEASPVPTAAESPRPEASPSPSAEPSAPPETDAPSAPVADITPAEPTAAPVESADAPAAAASAAPTAAASAEVHTASVSAPAAASYSTPSISISDVTLPADMEQRSVAVLRGKIATDCGYITCVYGALYDSAGAVAQDCVYWPYMEKVSLAGTVNTDLHFAYLEPDTYTYLVSARAENGSAFAETVLINHSFTVTKAASAQTAPSSGANGGGYTAKLSTGTDNASLIWNYFIEKLGNPCGAAAILGNIRSESTCCPTRVEGDISSDCAYSDLYTSGVDSGSVTREAFVSYVPDDGYGMGYGLCQWSSERKGELYDLAKASGVSVGDLTVQCEFIMKELSEDYPSLLEYLKTATDAEEAASEFCRVYERAQVHGGRTAYAAAYLEQFAA